MKKLYTFGIAFLALISIALVIMDYANAISIDSSPYCYIDNTILGLFTIDYFIRLIIAKNRVSFFKDNFFDLLAIIPIGSFFSFFRIARLARIVRITRVAKIFRVVRLIGLTGKLQKNAKNFLKTNGLIYLIIVSLFILIIAAVLYSLAESVPLGESLWWAIATATTVGYGDISPHTPVGKLAAILLMFVGIGFISMLTSSLTTFFTHEEDSNQKILKKLDELVEDNNELKKELREIKQHK
ncbi:potassium channel family protein [Liquorilactobacillus satsumensis]|uniref:potassium channel family protein n=1 Tax=Liquorilactobacillus satsumensis TaxID=259059 RepID=UPI0039E97C2F